MHRCLSENKGKKDFSRACKKEVVEFEEEESKDYRFNPRLRKYCAKDVPVLCSGVCTDADDVSSAGKETRGGVCRSHCPPVRSLCGRV